jgi:hypothetical protein
MAMLDVHLTPWPQRAPDRDADRFAGRKLAECDFRQGTRLFHCSEIITSDVTYV